MAFQFYIVHAILADSRGRLWFGINNQAVQFADGKTIVYEPVREANQPTVKFPSWNVIKAFAELELNFIQAHLWFSPICSCKCAQCGQDARLPVSIDS